MSALGRLAGRVMAKGIKDDVVKLNLYQKVDVATSSIYESLVNNFGPLLEFHGNYYANKFLHSPIAINHVEAFVRDKESYNKMKSVIQSTLDFYLDSNLCADYVYFNIDEEEFGGYEAFDADGKIVCKLSVSIDENPIDTITTECGRSEVTGYNLHRLIAEMYCAITCVESGCKDESLFMLNMMMGCKNLDIDTVTKYLRLSDTIVMPEHVDEVKVYLSSTSYEFFNIDGGKMNSGLDYTAFTFESLVNGLLMSKSVTWDCNIKDFVEN